MHEECWETEFRVDVAMRLIVPETTNPKASLAVLLHGMGQNGAIMQGKLAGAAGKNRHLLIPDGPLPFEKVEKEQRQIGRAWYLYTGDQAAFLASARRTAQWLNAEIDRLVARIGLDSKQVHLVGYSQGGYLAGLMVLQEPERFRSLTSICSRLKHEVWPEGADPAVLPPILVLHGERDRFLPLERAQESAEILARRGAQVDLRIFASGHGLSPEQAQATAAFLDQVDEGY